MQLTDKKPADTKLAGVMLEEWKLPTFKKHLDAAGCTYTEHPGLTAGTILLRVPYKWVADVLPVIEAANTECRENRPCN